jgi:low affinity Fe/Cu permease
MAQKQSNGSKASGASRKETSPAAAGNHAVHLEWFSRFAHETARLAGKPTAFIAAVVVVVVWAATGPLFDYSDTWQLVINTSTTIITFLMVFVIQHTQNRDTMALQVKLSELIIAVQGAKNRLATAEDLSEEELERLHDEYCAKADAARNTLEEVRAKRVKRDSPEAA